jgi:hypothetical protein
MRWRMIKKTATRFKLRNAFISQTDDKSHLRLRGMVIVARLPQAVLSTLRYVRFISVIGILLLHGEGNQVT